jgi:tetratricopeptide (TPR) repeat protein
MEQRLNDRIGDLQERLSHEHDSVQRAIYEQEIAYLYREFVYYGLVTKELEPFYLRNAAGHALRALEAYPDPAEVYLLLGKIYLYVYDFKNAGRAFTKAMEDPRYAEETLPYLAELTFAQKDFKNFRKILPALRRLHYSPKASKLTSLWRAS